MKVHRKGIHFSVQPSFYDKNQLCAIYIDVDIREKHDVKENLKSFLMMKITYNILKNYTKEGKLWQCHSLFFKYFFYLD